jgi:Zn-dependent peptidase ImmA (M78 family)
MNKFSDYRRPLSAAFGLISRNAGALCDSPFDRYRGSSDIRLVAGSLYSNTGAKRARETRAALGYTREGPLPDLIETIEQRGGAHAVVLELADGVAGAYVAKPDLPLLFVNGKQAITRQRFTLAHEFGHFRMGHSSVIDEQVMIGGFQHKPTEVSANAFAAEFLMPKEATRVWGAERVSGQVTLEHIVLFAQEYGVSAQAARYAFSTAGVLTDEERGRQLDAEIAEELHVELALHLGLEPVEDRLAEAVRRLPRIPPALEGSALGDALVGLIDVEELAARAHCSTDEMREALAEFHLDQLLPAG